MTSATDDSLADVLAARQDFRDLNAAYCRGIDRCDEPLLRSIWHPDATVAYGIFDGNALEFSSYITKLNQGLERTFHTVSNQYHKVDGDKAVGESYVIGVATAKVEGKLMDTLIGGRYLDRLERRNGVWKIAHRTYVMDWNMNMPATAEWDEGMYGMIKTRGKRDKSDPSYAVWEGK